jgi:hypothetical protein
MKWTAYGDAKETIDGYKYNFYEDKKGEFYLVIWRKPHYRRTVYLGQHLPSDILQKIYNEEIPKKIAVLIAEDTKKFLKKWI